MEPTIPSVRTTQPSVSPSRTAPSKGLKPVSPEEGAKKPLTTHTGAQRGVQTPEPASKEPPVVASLEQSLPLSILKHPSLAKAEWAWRRWITEVIQQTQAASTEQPDEDSSSVARSGIETLWKVMEAFAKSELVAGTAQQRLSSDWVHTLPGSQTEGQAGMLIPFHAMTADHVSHKEAEKIRTWILEDRIAHVVRQADTPIAGDGLYVLPQLPSKEQEERPVVKWEAERFTRVGPQGSVIHHLTVVVPFDSEKVAVTITSAHPTLHIHVSTNHAGVRRRLEGVQNLLSTSLEQLGWTLHSFSVGPREEAEG